ncbi:MAG: hypothetical protein ACTSYD_02415 [Candidatus Heimdallarchaeaceae archaeon]
MRKIKVKKYLRSSSGKSTKSTRIEKANKKYELTNIIKILGTSILHRIRALKSFGEVKKGELGGWIEKESNLSQKGLAWVFPSSIVYQNARVCDDAKIKENSIIYGNARVCGTAFVTGHSEIFGNAKVISAIIFDHAKIYQSAKVYSYAEVSEGSEIFGNAKVYGSASIYGQSKIYGNAKVHGRAVVRDASEVFGTAEICGDTWVIEGAKVSKGVYPRGTVDGRNNRYYYNPENLKDFKELR